MFQHFALVLYTAVLSVIVHVCIRQYTDSCIGVPTILSIVTIASKIMFDNIVNHQGYFNVRLLVAIFCYCPLVKRTYILANELRLVNVNFCVVQRDGKLCDTKSEKGKLLKDENGLNSLLNFQYGNFS